jgi:endonuclease-8
MPEGPVIVLLKEALQPFTGEIILQTAGKADHIDFAALEGKPVIAFKSWGKHLLICLPDITLKIHLMLFGSWLINSRKELPPRLSLQFKKGEINFYACSVNKIDSPLDEVYDWSEDVMNNNWNPQNAVKKLNQHPSMMVCDALLNQHFFSGVGNIIRNEVLFRTHIHPASLVGKIPVDKLNELVKEAVNYSHQFYIWRKAKMPKDQWLLVYGKSDKKRVINQIIGKSRRRCYYCPGCQKLYS